MNRSDYFALRINHFLKGYRKKNNLTQSEMATRIHTTKSTVSRIENGQDKQINEVLAMLERIAQLEGMELGPFINYLDASQSPATQSTLFPWQTAALEALAPIKQSLRLEVTAELLPLPTAEFESLLALLLSINRLPKASQALLQKLVSEMKAD